MQATFNCLDQRINFKQTSLTAKKEALLGKNGQYTFIFQFYFISNFDFMKVLVLKRERLSAYLNNKILSLFI